MGRSELDEDTLKRAFDALYKKTPVDRSLSEITVTLSLLRSTSH